jgi:hypothetical protein
MNAVSLPTNNGIRWQSLTGGVALDEPSGVTVATSLPIPLQECTNRKTTGNTALIPASCN